MNVLDDLAEVEAIVASARAAQLRFEANGSQARYDRAAQAAAWAIMEPSRNTHLAEELSLPPVKIHCSVLAEDAIKTAIDNYRGKK